MELPKQHVLPNLEISGKGSWFQELAGKLAAAQRSGRREIPSGVSARILWSPGMDHLEIKFLTSGMVEFGGHTHTLTAGDTLNLSCDDMLEFLVRNATDDRIRELIVKRLKGDL